MRALLVVVLALVSCGAAACSDSDGPPGDDAATASDEGAGAPSADAGQWYAPLGWPAIHRDGRNSDTSAASRVVSDFEPGFHSLPDATIGAVLTTDADDSVFVTTLGADGSGCVVHAIDADSGDTRWCTGSLTGRAISSSVTVDVDGNLFIADDVAMHSFTNDGEPRWSTPIEGNPLSAQFLPDGRLVFISHIGHIYVLDRSTGEVVVEHDLLADVDYDPEAASPADCLLGGADSTCHSANTLAVDPVTGRLFFTLAPPGQTSADLVAMDYESGDAPTLTEAWVNDSLDGGSAASPTLSADRTRVYTNDQADNLVAVDAGTGDTAWVHPLGFSPLGSPSVTEGGRIVPTGGPGSWVVALRDAGDAAEVQWERRDLVHAGVPAQTADDGPLYVVAVDAAKPDRVQLVVLDGPTGETLDLVDAPGPGTLTIGTTVGPSGNVYVAGLSGGVFGFVPAR